MSLIGIASKAGILTSAIESLLGGEVTVGIASRLHTPSNSLQKFLDGGTSVGLASHIGCTSSALQELRDLLGKEGATGFLLGLCFRSEQEG
jgi:hypothetical protein